VADRLDRHVDHDPMLIAAMLDDDSDDFERTAAAARVASCPDCAALHADLLALSAATREVPTPARPRDFRLTPADAAGLIAALGEPGAPSPRLTGVMTDTHAAAAHASHDTILVASLADHSLASSEREAAEALVAACGLCAALHADLVALSAATRAMPTPARPRDYTLTQGDAARLRPGGWRRWVAAFGTSRDALSRPLAVGLTTLGLAGLLVATIPSVLQGQGAALGGPASGASSERGPLTVANPGANADTGVPSLGGAAAAPSAGPLGPVYGALASPAPLPAASDQKGVALRPDQASPAPGHVDIAGGSSNGASAAPGGPNEQTGPSAERTLAPDATGLPLLLLLSGSLLIAGLGLFVIRWAARRFSD
jgi:hypothetical protein